MYEVCLRTVRNQDKITYYHVTTKHKRPPRGPRPVRGGTQDPQRISSRDRRQGTHTQGN